MMQCNLQLAMSICAQGLWGCAGGEFQVIFMLVALRPYGRFQRFLAMRAPAGQSKARVQAICGGFRS